VIAARRVLEGWVAFGRVVQPSLRGCYQGRRCKGSERKIRLISRGTRLKSEAVAPSQYYLTERDTGNDAAQTGSDWTRPSGRRIERNKHG
jgi:hypothetical protein